jgi:hypothetical protein
MRLDPFYEGDCVVTFTRSYKFILKKNIEEKTGYAAPSFMVDYRLIFVQSSMIQ